MSPLGLTPAPRTAADETAPSELGIDQKVAFLGSPEAYPDRPAHVERVETHFSFVFLTERQVYKLKKPVRAGGLDLSSPEGRRRNAEAEMRLNRRLAADVYLGVVPLTWAPRRGLAIGGAGKPVDWLVKMVRLPAEQMLDRRIASGNLRQGELHGLSERLAQFFAGARHVGLPPGRYCKRFRGEFRLTQAAFDTCAGVAQQGEARQVARLLEAFLARHRPLLMRRCGRLVEGHGDLRPEHIWLGAAVRVIDCLEFRPDLRLLDPADELAFLAMECARLGAPGAGRILFAHYRRRTRDTPPAVLVRFYTAVGALIRARIAIVHLREARVADPVKWTKRAGDYLAIARRHASHLC